MPKEKIANSSDHPVMPLLMSIFQKTAGMVFPSTLPQLPEPAASRVESAGMGLEGIAHLGIV